MNVPRDGKEIAEFEHFHGFFADGGSCFFQIKFACHGNDENVMVQAFAHGDQRLENAGDVDAEDGGDFHSARSVFGGEVFPRKIAMAFVAYFATVKYAHYVCLFHE